MVQATLKYKGAKTKMLYYVKPKNKEYGKLLETYLNVMNIEYELIIDE